MSTVEMTNIEPESAADNSLPTEWQNYFLGDDEEYLNAIRRQAQLDLRAALPSPDLVDDSILVDSKLDSEEPSARSYLHEIGRAALLDKDQEATLAQKMELGLAAQQRLESDELIPEEEQIDLLLAAELGSQAKEAFIEANLRLVVSIAKKYRNGRMAFLDLIQEGNLGLYRAVELYNWRKGFRFSTYATWWIRQTITRAVSNQAHAIRLPVHVVEKQRNIYAVRQRISTKMGRNATLEEIANESGMSMPRVVELLRNSAEMLSLDQPLDSGNTDSASLEAVIPDTSTLSVDMDIRDMAMAEKVEKFLSTLNERERKIITLRYGLDGGSACTLEQVGEEFNITRERIRQIENVALNKMRAFGNTCEIEMRELLSEAT